MYNVYTFHINPKNIQKGEKGRIFKTRTDKKEIENKNVKC